MVGSSSDPAIVCPRGPRGSAIVSDPRADRIILGADQRLADRVRELSRQRLVFFAGLPGTGKSLLVHQLAHVARAAGRRVHLLQWDVARPVFESSPAGRRYPVADGVTHAMIRVAAGSWVRHAVAAWCERHADPAALLVGETPFVGNRFVELARPGDDPAEAVLGAPSCRFAVAVPSAAVRRFLEAERARRAISPRHHREREDAPPHVLRALWRDLVDVARALGVAPGLAGPAGGGGDAPEIPYDPETYRRVYESVLRHRHVDVVALDAILPTGALSVYDFADPPLDLVPTEAEADDCIRVAERRHPDSDVLARAVARWWAV
jgi:hypothetical protein